MTASKRDTSTASPKIGSDLAKVDAYQNTPADYDEIPELDDAFFERATPDIKQAARRGRPPAGDEAKQLLSLRLDKATLDRFKAAGPGWQVRMGRLLAVNEVVLKMIRENLDLIDSMESMLSFMRKGEMRMVFEPIETTIAKVEQNVRTVTETTASLRDQLVVE